MCLGGGDAWKKDHDKILDHARGLHYDHVPGVTLPSADAPKQEWISAMDAFNAWKARERAKEASGQAWWQTYKGDSGGDSGGGGGSGPPDWDNPDPSSGTGPYPDDNIYFPMLVPDYEAPKALDWGRYMPRGYMPGSPNPNPNLTGGPIHGGLLYQPWTSNYQHHFVPDSLWDYRPPELKVGRPKFYQTPLGILEVVHHQPESSNGNGSNNNDDEYDWTNDPEGRKGGKWKGDVGHETNEVTGDLLGWLGSLFGGDEPDPTGPEAAVSDANNPSTTGVTYD